MTSHIPRLTPDVTPQVHRDAVTAVSVSADRRTVHSVGQDGHLTIYDVEDKRQIYSGEWCLARMLGDTSFGA
jgi:WD40 repeat protein